MVHGRPVDRRRAPADSPHLPRPSPHAPAACVRACVRVDARVCAWQVGARVVKQVAPKPRPWAVAVKYCGCFKNRSDLPAFPPRIRSTGPLPPACALPPESRRGGPCQEIRPRFSRAIHFILKEDVTYTRTRARARAYVSALQNSLLDTDTFRFNDRDKATRLRFMIDRSRARGKRQSP